MITKETFIKIFKNSTYRKKLDQIILNFFGLDIGKEVVITKEENQVIHEIVLFLNTEIALRIKVVDKEKLFLTSKRFYINLSYRKVEKYFELLIPCYYEIYCPYSKNHLKSKPKIFLIAALFSCQNEVEVKTILNKLKVFNESEKKDILSKLEMHK